MDQERDEFITMHGSLFINIYLLAQLDSFIVILIIITVGEDEDIQL